jgi:hypothetical protein
MVVPYIKVRDSHMGSHFTVKHICHLLFMDLLMPKIVSEFRFLTVAIVVSQMPDLRFNDDGSSDAQNGNMIMERLLHRARQPCD